MTISPDQPLALVEVARLIFRTQTPSETQVARVQKLMQSGLLPECNCSGPPACWTTTAGAIATYLAQESLKRQSAKHAAQSSTSAGETQEVAPSPFDGRVPEAAETAHIKSLYKGLWSEYFLTLFMQRKAANRSRSFKHAVLAGQIALLGIFLLAMIFSVGLSIESIPPERAAVEKWIDERTDHYAIQTWHPPVPTNGNEGVILRVEYTYRQGKNRPIFTDRRFLVVGEQVREVVESD